MRASLLAAFRVAGLALALVLQLAWLVQPLPPAMKILPASLGVVSAVHPATGLIALAGLGPMANAMSLWAQSPLPGIRLLEQLVLAFVFGAGLRWWRTADSRLREAAALLAASAIASFIAVQPALLLQRAPDVSAWGHVRAQLWRGESKSVLLCAADTFRAAAIEQLEIWGQRTDVEVIRQSPGADPSAVLREE